MSRTIDSLLYQELEALVIKLVESGLADDQNYPTSKSDSRGWSVSGQPMPLGSTLKSRHYAEQYADILENRNYSVRFLDGALMQASYSGVKDQIVKHRLAYFPSPDLRPFQEDPDLYISSLPFAEVVGWQVFPVVIRFDFDSTPGVAVNQVHPVSHLTLGQYKNCRIPAAGPITPYVFAQFIIRHFYSHPSHHIPEFKSHVGAMVRTLTSGEASGMHINFPTA